VDLALECESRMTPSGVLLGVHGQKNFVPRTAAFYFLRNNSPELLENFSYLSLRGVYENNKSTIEKSNKRIP